MRSGWSRENARSTRSSRPPRCQARISSAKKKSRSRWRSPNSSQLRLVPDAAIGDEVDLRLRRNRQFHAPDPAAPLILVGNGTGIAGLRALLKERAATGAARNWLLFGERQRERDFFFADEIEGWLRDGLLERVDLAFSRDQAERVYVQQRLREAAGTVREWVAAGACISVCGSLQGMAPDVDHELRAALGAGAVDALIDAGRYRRDVY